MKHSYVFYLSHPKKENDVINLTNVGSKYM